MTQICGSDDIVQKADDFLRDADDIVRKADDFLRDADDIARGSDEVFKNLVVGTPFHRTLDYSVRDRPIWFFDQNCIVQLLRH